jgi:hypothetical protein
MCAKNLGKISPQAGFPTEMGVCAGARFDFSAAMTGESSFPCAARANTSMRREK